MFLIIQINDFQGDFSDISSTTATLTERPVNIQTKAFFTTDSRRDAEYYRGQTSCHSVRKSKVLQMQP